MEMKGTAGLVAANLVHSSLTESLVARHIFVNAILGHATRTSQPRHGAKARLACRFDPINSTAIIEKMYFCSATSLGAFQEIVWGILVEQGPVGHFS